MRSLGCWGAAPLWTLNFATRHPCTPAPLSCHQYGSSDTLARHSFVQACYAARDRRPARSGRQEIEWGVPEGENRFKKLCEEAVNPSDEAVAARVPRRYRPTILAKRHLDALLREYLLRTAGVEDAAYEQMKVTVPDGVAPGVTFEVNTP